MSLLPAASQSAPAVGLPAGSSIQWYGDTYQVNAGNPVIPNSAVAAATPKNLLRYGRRQFNGTFYGRNSASVVDNNVVGPDGKTEASTITGTGAGSWGVFVLGIQANSVLANFANVLPAGTYTMAVNAIRVGGTNQTFRLAQAIFGGPFSGTFTATASWQRFTYTFTLGSPGGGSMGIAGDGTNNATIAVCDLELYQGSSDLGPEALNGHLQLGHSAFSCAPDVANGIIDFTHSSSNTTVTTGGAVASASFLTGTNDIATNGCTVSVLVNLVKDPAVNSSTDWFMQDSSGVANQFVCAPKYGSNPGNNFPAFVYNNVNVGPFPAVWNPYVSPGLGWHVITFRADNVGAGPGGTGTDIWFDDTRISYDGGSVYQGRAAPTSPNVKDIWMGWGQIPGTVPVPGCDKVHAVVMWRRALSVTEIYNTVDSLMSRLFTKTGIQTALQPTYIMVEGDSLSQGYAGDPNGSTSVYPYWYRAVNTGTPPKPVVGSCTADPGSTLYSNTTITLENRKPWLKEGIPFASGRTGFPRKWVMSCWLGANDYANIATGVNPPGPMSTYMTRYGSNITDLKNNGLTKFYAATVIANDGGASAESGTVYNGRLQYNGDIKTGSPESGVFGVADGNIDFAANANLGAQSAGLNATYYTTSTTPGYGTHTNQTGQDICRDIWKPVMEPLY